MVDRGIISNSVVDSNQILPMRYLWARRHYKRSVANHWIPESILMGPDLEQWKSNVLSKDEKRVVESNLGFLAAASTLIANNVVLVTYRYVTSPECRQYLLCQAYECMIHADAVLHCGDSFNLDLDMIHSMGKTVPTMKAKLDFILALSKPLGDVTTTMKDKTGICCFLKDLIGFYLNMEGIFCYSGFAIMGALKRTGKLIGVGQQFEQIMRDMSLHCAFGFDLINTIKSENPALWTAQLQQEIIQSIRQAVVLEKDYIRELCSTDILDVTAQQLCVYVEYLADIRLERIDLDPQYNQKNPFVWMEPTHEFATEEPFFDTQGVEYQTAETVEWE